MSARPIHRQWFSIQRPRPAARLRLFCLPFAGGGASIFRSWADQVSEQIEICAVQLPGRENRVSEPLYTDLEPLAAASADGIAPYTAKPFAFFGHSMGALVAFEMTRALRRRGHALPCGLLVAGRRAPHVPRRKPPTYDLPDDEFLADLRRTNGDRPTLLDDGELAAVMLPLVRADVTVCDTYAYYEESPLPCAISAWGGCADPEISAADMAAWSELTAAAFSLSIVPGDHFFPFTSESSFLRSVCESLERLADTDVGSPSAANAADMESPR